jgi:2-polyprenyl-6-methoxyphenol hydroxylase-like FAD-dependent oxidoreductase
MIPQHSPVLIVGGGPCGLMLSIELARRGIPLLLIDAKTSQSLNPQANATQARTMEHYRRLGFAEEIRSKGLPPDYPTDIAYFTRYAGRELARFRRPASRQAGELVRNLAGSWSAAELPHRVSQKFVEGVLRRHASANPLASINFGWRLKSFEQGPDQVEATVEHVETGAERRVSAQYLVGADGARSTVRRALGVTYGGETGVQRDFFGGRMAAVYLRAPDFYSVLPHDRAWMYWAFNAERRSWLAAVNGIDEFAFHTQLKPGEDEKITEARARFLFRQVMGTDLQIEVLAVDTWIAGHALVAESFQTGRVFIAGDAAHLFTPAGGLGYNTAVEDAVNLGWKLAAAIKGQAGAALLDSYGYERRKLAIRNTGFARHLAESIGNFVPNAALESDGEDGDRARAEAGAYLGDHAKREFDIPGVTFGGRYDGSTAIIAEDAPLPADQANAYVPTASPGGRPPHLWLEDGTSLYDLFGFEWSLLAFGTEESVVDSFARAAKRLGIDLRIVRLPNEAIRQLYEADYALIRPDQIVAWRGNGREDAESLLLRLLARAAPGAERIVA